MLYLELLLLTLLAYHTRAALETNVLSSPCKPTDKVCKFPKLHVRTQLSMSFYNQTSNSGFRAFVDDNGKMYYKTKCNTSVEKPLTEKEADTINAVDGTFRYITTINGQFPGPTLVVYEGQTVEVTFVNEFQQQGMGVHFHGLSQRCTNWMDGVPGINQCAFNMGESFTYKFKVDPVGTHWYHSHYGFQRIDGLYGAFIVLPKPGRKSKVRCKIDKDFVMEVQEFYPLDNNHMFTSLYQGFGGLLSYAYYGQCPGMENNCTGSDATNIVGNGVSPYPFYSALVNGKGRRYDTSGDPIHLVPLETYNVKGRHCYTYHLINTGTTFSWNVSIDQHKLIVTRTEVGPIEPVVVDNIIINIAERYEFVILTNQPMANYWIRIDTLGVPNPSFTRAILHYEGADRKDPTSQRKVCTERDKCVVLGCPYLIVAPLTETSRCIHIDQLKSTEGYTVTPVQTETMLQFSFTETESGHSRASINGILLDPPTVPPSVLGHTKYDNPCKSKFCTPIACKCTHQIVIPFNNTVQHTFFSKDSSHPVHTHGYWFHVLKIGYPTYYENNTMREMTKDITCLDKGICNNARWTNRSWEGGNIPGLHLDNPVVKDTITIPAGGYVVVRFVANNTGWWFMHCHIDPHFGEGMAMIQQVGDPESMVPAPPTMHLCGDVNERELKKSAKNKKKLVKLIRNMKKKLKPSGVKKYTKLEIARLIDKCTA